MYEVRLLSVEKAGDTYNAKLEVKGDGRQRIVEINRLTRRPGKVSARVTGDNLVIEIYDEKGEGYASCIIYLPNLEKKECKSLLVPQ